jgi:endonuclease III
MRSPRGSAAARPRVPRRESKDAKRDRAARLTKRLAETYPDATCELDWRNPFELLIATILSAQCTDKMVNQVTPALFEQFPDAAALASSSPRRVEALIKRTGFFRQKAKSIRACAHDVAALHDGRVPAEMDALTKMQGVGRKTASVVLGTAFGEPAIFVDTHVNRLCNRLGLTTSDDPAKIELQLRELLPPEHWVGFCHRLIHHGRRICSARSPKCAECALADLCPRVGVKFAKIAAIPAF